MGEFDDDEEHEDESKDEKSVERKTDYIDGNDDEEEEMDEDEEEEGGGLLEDEFLKIKELEYLEEDEAREYGLKKDKKKNSDDETTIEESDEDGEGEENEEDHELEALGLDDNEDENGNTLENARYEDFFGGKRNSVKRKKPKLIDGSDDSDMFGEHSDDDNLGQKKENLSTRERKLEKVRSKIEQMEKANLEPKTWTMQGEVTAAKRPKNNALEVDLDFEHNVRPAPVITEEVTASREDLIQKQIAEDRFDDVQKTPALLSKASREIKELDENKSKKGLAEVYEVNIRCDRKSMFRKLAWFQRLCLFQMSKRKRATSLEMGGREIGGRPADMHLSQTLRLNGSLVHWATLLFKKLCLKLDALSHFHFTPKPVIEEMSIQTNVPTLAMEEIAPVAVSEAAMLYWKRRY